jgi:hypothetical protein
MDAEACEMMRAEADGQVAWSWSPDAGIKLVEMIRRRRRLTSPDSGESAK